MNDAVREGVRDLLLDDLERAVAALPGPLAWVLHEFGPRAFVAGGHIRGTVAREPCSDVDVFVKDGATARDLVARLGGEPFTTAFASTVVLGGIAVQVIHRWHFAVPADVLAHFDFSVCQAALWYDAGWRSACTPDFYPDLAGRRLRYQRSGQEREGIETGGTLLRLTKYARKGYSASPETVAAITWDAVQSLADGDTVDRLIEYLRGVDPGYRPAWLKADAPTLSTSPTESDPSRV